MKSKSTFRLAHYNQALAALMSLLIGSLLMPNQAFGASVPIAEDDPNFLTVTEDDGLTTVSAVGVLANDTPKGGVIDRVNADTALIGVTFTLISGATLKQNVDGSVEYNPNGAFEWLDDSESTTDTYEYTINTGNRDSADVTITITGVNDAPVGVDDSGAGFSTDEDTSFTTASALTNDTDIDVETLTISGADTLSAKGASVTILDANAGTFTYDPTGSATLQALTAAGSTTDTFSYTVSDGDATDTATITIAVSGVNDGPTGVLDWGASFITNEDSSFTTGNVLSNDTDPDTDPVADPLTVTLVDVTSFMGASVTILDASGGTFTYDPTGSATLQALDDAASTFDSFSYTISDGVLTDTATVLIQVTGLNDAPVGVDDSGAGFSTNEDASFTTGSALINDTDVDVEALTLAAVDAVSAKGASVFILDASAGTFTYDPTGSATLQALTAAGNTTDTFSYTVSDGDATDTATITISVSGMNDAPTGVDDSGAGFSTDEDTSFTTGNVLTNDLEIDAESLTVTLVDSTSAMGASVTILDASGGTFTYDPTGSATLQALDVTEDTTDTFSYTLSDGITTSTATVTIAVTALNDAPIGVDDSGAGFATDEDTAFTTFGVIANDTDVDVEALTVSAADATSAKGASVTILDANAGTFTYDPTGSATLQALVVASNTTDTFSYTVSDGTTTDTATVTISVSGLNDAPTGVNDSGVGFSTDEDTSFATGNVLNNDLETDAESLTVTLVDTTSAKGASVTILDASGGTFTYDPTGSATLQALDDTEDTTDTFTYTLSDGTTTSTATVTIAITALNDAPVGVDDAGVGFSTNEDAAFTTGSALTNDTDVDVETLMLAGVDVLSAKGASVVILDANAGTFTYDPTGSATLQALTAADNTTDTFSYTVSDGTDTDTATITISVSGLNDAPTGVNDSGAGFSTDEDSSFTTGNVLTNDIEPDAESLTVTLVDATSAKGASVTILSAGGGTFTYDPTGSATLQALDDAENTTDTFTYTLSDGTITSTATVTVSIAGVNDAPVGVNDSGAGFSTDEDASFTTGNVLNNDTDVDVETLILASVDATSAKGASVMILDANAGTFTYDASGSATLQALDDAENTTDTFSYTLSDGTTTSIATVTISVAGLNDAPVGVDDAPAGNGFFTTNENRSSWTTGSVLTNDIDVDVETLTVSAADATSAKGASVLIDDANLGTFKYDPTGSATLQALIAGGQTTDTFSYTVSDGTDTDTATVTIKVNGRNDDPTGVDDSGVGFSTDEDSSFATGNVLSNDLEIDDEALFVTLVDATSSMGASVIILDASGGTFTYDPTGSATLQALDVTEDVLDTFSYTLSDGTTTSTATVTIAVTALNDAPVGIDDGGAGFATDEDTSFTTVSVLINDTDVDVETLTVSAADAVSAKGASVTILDASAGTFTYDPSGSATLQALAAAGNTTDTFSYTVSDGTDTDTATVTISVSGLNDAPTGVNDSGAGFSSDEDSSFATGNVLTNDIEPDADPLTVTLVDATSAKGASVTILSASGGTFTYDPTGSATLQALDDAENTTDTFTYTLSDGAITSTATVTISIAGLNDTPVGVNDSGAGFATDEDASFTTGNVLTNDTDIDVETLILTAVDATSAKGASVTILDVNAGTFTYDASGSATLQALDDTENTTDTFSYTLSDGTTTSSATVTMSVTGLNDAPTGVDDAGAGFATDEDSPLTTVSVLTNDTDIDVESLELISVDALSAKGASVKILSFGSSKVVYDPTGSATLQALAAGDNTTDTFTYTVSDGTTTDTATVTISVSGLNDAPTGVNDSGVGFSGDEDSSFTTGNVLTNDIDIDGDPLTVTLVDATSAKGASVTILSASGGTFTYDPTGSATLQALDDAENTTDTFTYTLSDGAITSTATVTVSIGGLNDAPVGVDDSGTGFKTTEDASFTTGNVLINDIDIDVETLTLTGVDVLSAQGASVVILDANAGTFTYDASGSATLQALDDAENTTDTFSYTLSDGTTTSTATVTMSVSGLNDAPVGVDDSGLGYSTSNSSTLTTPNTLINDTDIDVETLKLAGVDALSAKGASVVILDANAGTFIYDPRLSAILDLLILGQNTTDTFSYTVTDGTTTGTATVTILVFGLNSAPSGVDDSGIGFSTDEDSSFITGNVLANDVDAEGDPLSVKLVDATSAMGASVTILDASGGTFTYDPTGSATIQALDTGEDTTDTFSYTLSDGTFNVTATVTIAITALNDAPVGIDDSGAGFSTDEDALFTTPGVLTNDTDVDVETLTVTAVDAISAKGAIVTILDPNAGTFTYDPNDAATLQILTSADNTTDTFNYTVSDGTDTDTATVTLDIAGLDDSLASADNTITAIEDTPYVFTGGEFAFVSSDPSDTLVHVTIGALPVLGDLKLLGAPVTPGQDILAADVTNLTYDSDPDDDGSAYATFDFLVFDGIFDSPIYTITIDVTADPDVPNVTSLATVTVDEDTPFNPGISASLNDPTNETLTVTLSGLPAGVTISDGTNSSATASTDITTWNLAAIEVTLITHDDSDFTLTITAVATETNGGASANAVSNTITTVTAVADTPNLSVTNVASGNEDSPIALTVSGSLVDTDGSEVLTYQITNVPAGATLNNGVDAGAGVWNLAAADVTGLTITGKTHDDSDFTIQVTSIATDNDASTATSAAEDIVVTVVAVADMPTLSVTGVINLPEDSNPIPLTIAADLIDTDGSETLVYSISGVIASATLSTGTDAGGGIWTLTEAEAETGLTLTMVDHDGSDFQLLVSAVAIEANDGSSAFSTPADGIIDITINDIADTPTLTVTSPATGDEDTAIALTVSSSLVDTDGSETLSVYIEGHPASAAFSAGSDAGGGRWDIDVLDLAGLTISAAANNNDDFILTFTSTTVETDGGDTSSSVETINVTIQAVNDAPTVNDNGWTIDENTPNATVLGTVVASDIEPIGSEPGQTLSYAIAGTAFSIDSSGVVRVNDAAQLDYETTSSFVLLVTVTDNGAPNEQDTATVTIDLNPLDDEVPIANDDFFNVDELGTINFNVLDNDTDGDLPPEPLRVIRTMGSDSNVGELLELLNGGVLVGTVTLNADGSGVFTANPDSTIEKFQRQLGYTIVSANGTVRSEPAFVYFTVNPINDNQPELTDAGIVLDDIQDLVAGETSGIQYTEDDSSTVIALPLLFSDLDIDTDGMLDGDTSDDNDSLVFSVISNSNPGVVSTSLVSGVLTLTSPPDAFGQATLQIQAIDTAAPAVNISAVVLTMTVTVASDNDSPVYVIDGGGQPFYQNSNFVFDEDTGPVVIDLANAFVDADLLDATPGDDLLTYTVTIIDQPNASVLSQVLDLTAIGACPAVPTCISSDSGSGGGNRTVVIETTATSLTLPLFGDAHGAADITVRATDLGLPNGTPLFDEGTFRVTVNELDDDQPVAQDDHYNDFPGLVMDEDDVEIVFNVLQNDYQGDVPARVIMVGQQFTDSGGTVRAWRTTTRLADPADTGDYTIQFNGEVSCADLACTDGETAGSQISGAGIGAANIVYRPGEDFNGEDSFTYCIMDTSPAGEAPFTPPADSRCATVTVNVLVVNDPPIADNLVIYTMDQAGTLIVPVEDGLINFVRDIDNNHLDGIGCDPSLPSCTPGAGDPQPDPLFFYYSGGVATTNGLFVSPFTADGAFNYIPDGSFSGSDEFEYEVCDTPTPGDLDHCDQGVVSIQITPLSPAPSGSSDGAVEFDYQLAVSPLELPIGPEPNVLILNDDSGSMGWDIMADGDMGRFRLPGGRLLRWVNKATADSTSYLAASEQRAPGIGLWKLRNANFNTVYYNPLIQYRPWEGLNTNDAEFPDSPPTAARHNPLSASKTTNLTTEIDYRGRAAFVNGSGNWYSTNVDSDDYYIPRYYKWTDRNGNNLVDSVPSPVTDPTNSEGELIEIRSGSTYPRGVDRTDCATSPTSCTYAEELQNFANWFSYYRSRELTAKAAIGLVISGSENLRVGYAKINSKSNIIPVKTMNTSSRTGTKAALLDAVYATNSSSRTPLRSSLRDAGRYFECVADDIFDSTGTSLPGSAACPVEAAPAGNCQNNFTLLITDGTWNGSDPGTGNSDGDNSSNFDGGAFAGSESVTLADVAMQYYERDLHGSLDNEVPTSSRDRALADVTAFENSDNEVMHQHMTTFTVGFGVAGLVLEDPTDYTQAFTWGDPFSSTQRKNDDVRHAAYNGRGAYLDAGDGALLSSKLVAAFAEFSQGNGSASAVSFNSQEILEDTLIYRSFYNTKRNTGDLIAQTFTEEGVVETPVWSAADKMDSVAATDREIMTLDPGTDPTRTHGGIPFRGASLSPSQRDIFISDPTASETEKNTEVNQKVNHLRGDSAWERPVGNYRERPTINGRLGDIVHSAPVYIGPPDREDRDRSPFPQSELYSSFAAVHASTRQPLVYVSANDGMLHAYDASSGVEKFGFVPNNLMLGIFSEKITDLLNYEYSHKYFVDLTPAINDVFVDADDDGNKEWTTLLMGGQGGGAKAYFALNITDTSKLTEATAGDVVMWEFTDADDAYPTDASGDPLLSGGTQRLDVQNIPRPIKDLGHTFSIPTLAMSNLIDANGDNEWVAIFGNGYNSTSGIAKLFVLFLDRGVDGTWCHPDKKHNIVLNVTPLPAGCATDEYDFVKIDTTFGVKNGFPNGLGTPRGVDTDGNGTLDYAYAGDTFGNFFRFDLTSSDFSDWSYTKIFKAEYEVSPGNFVDQPITTQPILVQHPTESDGYIVLFGTGSYMTVPDGPSLAIQSMYGLWDRLSPELIDKSDLVQQRYTNRSDAIFGFVRSLSSNEVDYSITGGKKGWFNDLDSVAEGGSQGLDSPEFPGERAIRNIQHRGGRAFVNTVIPRSNTSCVDVAGGFALAFCPGTGGDGCLGDGVFDLNNDGEFDTFDEVDNSIVAGMRFEQAVPTDSSFIGDTRVTQLSNQDLETVGTNTNFGSNLGRLSWKQLQSID